MVRRAVVVAQNEPKCMPLRSYFIASRRRIMRNARILVANLALAFATVVGATSEYQSAQLARYEKFAGEPVEEMPFWRMQGFESLGKDAVLVWTGVSNAWLVRVFEPCVDLPWANSIGLTSSMHKVSVQFDFVLAKNDRCKIKSIQAIDYKAYRREHKQN